jgi:hypothetical protein
MSFQNRKTSIKSSLSAADHDLQCENGIKQVDMNWIIRLADTPGVSDEKALMGTDPDLIK